MAKEEKTNVMRLLDAAGIAYVGREYDPETVDVRSVALALGEDPETVFKTLIAENQKKERFAFCVPVTGELDLKKAAKAVGEKSVEMIRVSEINAVTGYIRGGCSPVGMKKKYKTVFHSSALEREKIAVSAGKIGHQILVSPRDLISFTDASVSDIVRDCSE